MGSSRVPQRTCAGCRKVFDQDTLMRLVRSPQGDVVVDLAHKLPGRGVYLCYDLSCVEAATVKGQLQRGFRKPVEEIEGRQLVNRIVAQLFEQLTGQLALMRKAGQLQAGVAQVLERLGRDPYALLVLAEDISQGRAEKLLSKARACHVECVYFATKEQLGHWVGKGESSALGLSPGGLAERFKQAFARYRQLSGEL